MNDISKWGPADWLAVIFCSIMFTNLVVIPICVWMLGYIGLLAQKAYHLGRQTLSETDSANKDI